MCVCVCVTWTNSHKRLSLSSLLQVVGQALIETLAEGLGDVFTKEVKEAYVAFYGVITKNMKDGLNEAKELEED